MLRATNYEFVNSVVHQKVMLLISVFIQLLSLTQAFTRCQIYLA